MRDSDMGKTLAKHTKSRVCHKSIKIDIEMHNCRANEKMPQFLQNGVVTRGKWLGAFSGSSFERKIPRTDDAYCKHQMRKLRPLCPC